MGWAVTCPVLLVHLSNIVGEETYNVARAMRLVIELNLMVLLGATSSFASGWDAYAYYAVSCVICLILFLQAWFIFQEAIVRLPRKALPWVLGMMACFYVGWSAFGIVFFFSAEGWGPRGDSASARDNKDIVGIIHSLCEIITKLLFGFFGWYLRWHVIRGKDGRRAEEEEEDAGPPVDSEMREKFERRRRRREAEAAGAAVVPLQRTVLLGCGQHDQLGKVVQQKLVTACGLKVTMVHNPLAFTSALDSRAHHFELVVCSYNWMAISDGKIGGHQSMDPDSNVKVLPLILFAQKFTDHEFRQAKEWGIDDYLDAPFFDEDVQDVISEALIQAKGLRYALGIKDTVVSSHLPPHNGTRIAVGDPDFAGPEPLVTNDNPPRKDAGIIQWLRNAHRSAAASLHRTSGEEAPEQPVANAVSSGANGNVAADVALDIRDVVDVAGAYASATREDRKLARRMSMDDGTPNRAPTGDGLTSHPLTPVHPLAGGKPAQASVRTASLRSGPASLSSGLSDVSRSSTRDVWDTGLSTQSTHQPSAGNENVTKIALLQQEYHKLEEQKQQLLKLHQERRQLASRLGSMNYESQGAPTKGVGDVQVQPYVPLRTVSKEISRWEKYSQDQRRLAEQKRETGSGFVSTRDVELDTAIDPASMTEKLCDLINQSANELMETVREVESQREKKNPNQVRLRSTEDSELTARQVHDLIHKTTAELASLVKRGMDHDAAIVVIQRTIAELTKAVTEYAAHAKR